MPAGIRYMEQLEEEMKKYDMLNDSYIFII